MDLAAALTGALNGYSQATRHIQIDTALSGKFVVERFHGREAVNESFRFEIDVLSNEPFLDLNPLIGSAARLRLATASGERCWNGYITHAAYADSDGGLTRYRLTLESWLAFLHLRRNCLYFVDLDTEGICERVFGDYPEARRRYALNDPLRTYALRGQYRETDFSFVMRQLSEAGLSFRIEHAQDGGKAPSGEHTVVVFDRRAEFARGSTIAFNQQDVGDPDGVMTQFTERHRIVPDRVVATSWKASELLALAGQAQGQPDDGAPVMPVREIFDGQRAGRFDTSDGAQRYADQRLDALRLPKLTHHGAGSSRTLETGKVHTLTGYLGKTIEFVPLSIDHEAVNNLGAEIAQLLERGELEQGLYRNRFVAVPAGVPIVPPYRDRPTVSGVQTAIVVGEPGNRVSSTRDHQVRIQFPWMRGTAPLPGGLTNTASRSNPAGHAPGNHQSGVLARLAEQTAGPNFGHSFTPRIGAEVVVGFDSSNIDMPVVLGQVYGGHVQPPFAAGEGSSANHPGTLTGMQTQTLDGQSGSRWVMDDASGQSRHEVLNAVANSSLAQGYLIAQQGAVRGTYRGEGFELATQGWSVVRAGEGVLVSSTARAQASSSQMDIAESVGQLKQAVATARRLDGSATGAKAGGLAGNPAQADFLKAIDPQQDGKYTGAVNGQSATRPTATQREGGEPVERFAAPAIVLESPESIALTTPASAVSYAAEYTHLTVQGDAHLGAGATVAGASNDAVSLYSAAGGVKAIANQGPVSVEAHTAAMEILADQSVRIVSSEDRIDVLAQDAIVLQQGPSRITLKGADITVETPGQFLVKAGSHPFPGPATTSPSLPALPVSPSPGEACEFLAGGFAGGGASATAAAATSSLASATAAAATPSLASATAAAATPSLTSAAAAASPALAAVAASAVPQEPAPASAAAAPPASPVPFAPSAASQSAGAARPMPSIPISSELAGPPSKLPPPPPSACARQLQPAKENDYAPEASSADYYQTDASGHAVGDSHGRAIFLTFASWKGKFDIEYSPADTTLTATVLIQLVPKDQYLVDGNNQPVLDAAGNPTSVPFNGDGPVIGGNLRQYSRTIAAATVDGFQRRIESCLNRSRYYLRPKFCPRGGACTCKVSIAMKVKFVTTGRFHKSVDLYPTFSRADASKWGETQVTWDRNTRAYVPLATQNAMAHETGHLFGWPDEYFENGGAVYRKYINEQGLVNVQMNPLTDDWQRTSDTNLMGQGAYSERPAIRKYYMYGFRDWLKDQNGIEWDVLK
ncbi:type VI secretion system tip protein VgrG [Paraburkholderia silviterrae]|uniref:Type VI secretion system tip protein VgrG n=1 Tax=Paraburkholderia silviterrae TaxID=2528715 RepID=A0A4R5LXW6_9BURK|nr:type VI secretion system tip protein TssI/VgrG [Paraburkholderia silviterrae]TDG16952.1 type VI secretion system tip protein VgrG [Paraburkholderia silviterrae]